MAKLKIILLVLFPGIILTALIAVPIIYSLWSTLDDETATAQYLINKQDIIDQELNILCDKVAKTAHPDDHTKGVGFEHKSTDIICKTRTIADNNFAFYDKEYSLSSFIQAPQSNKQNITDILNKINKVRSLTSLCKNNSAFPLTHEETSTQHIDISGGWFNVTARLLDRASVKYDMKNVTLLADVTIIRPTTRTFIDYPVDFCNFTETKKSSKTIITSIHHIDVISSKDDLNKYYLPESSIIDEFGDTLYSNLETQITNDWQQVNYDWRGE